MTCAGGYHELDFHFPKNPKTALNMNRFVRKLPIILAALTVIALCALAEGTAWAQNDDVKAKPSAGD